MGSATTDLTVESMLARMREGTEAVHEIRMRGMTFHVRVLSLDETNEIRRFSISESQRLAGDRVDMNVEMQKATLKLASTLQDRGVPIISDKLLAALSTDEVNYLFEEYIRVIDSVNPSLEAIGEVEFRALVDALKKNLITSRDCSLKQLRAICTAYQATMLGPDVAASPPAS